MRFTTLVATLFLLPAALAQAPKVNDERLKIELVAEAPDIATPIGIDIDDKGRIYVIESHTHFPQPNYAGPKTDRIRIYEDLNGDKKADRITNFHVGETHTMGIALYRDGSLYVATRREVFRLRDTNSDGVADERTSLVKLETKGNYPHNGLSGFAFDFKGDVYFGFGENLGESYKLIGSDNVTLEGGGEGGNIYSCDKDGKKLRRVATGFWNPFHMCFDAFGRLFAVDNDPDGRPPCRLLHIVEGGDYGYRFRYGRGGQHPFTSWNGEIPGTLPMVSGTGEAPSGMLAYESDNLPDDYLGTLLVTSWGDHRIEKYRLKPSGASFTSRMEPVVTGGDNFRPVGIALAPDGSVYFSDWVDKSYNVHGEGRIWRLSAKEEKKAERPDPVKEPENAILSKHRPTREKAVTALIARVTDRESFIDDVFLDPPKRRVDERGRAALLQAAAIAQPLDRKQSYIVGTDASFNVRTTAARLVPLDIWRDEPIRPTGRLDWESYAEIVRREHPFPLVPFDLGSLATADPFIFHAKLSGLRHQEPDRLLSIDLSKLSRIDETTKQGAFINEFLVGLLLAQRQSNHPQALQFVTTYLNDPSSAVRFAAIQWIAEEKLTQYRQQLTDSLSRPDTTPRLLVATLTALDMLDGGKPGSVDHVGGRWYLERLVFGEKTTPATRAMALRMLPANNPALTIEAFKKLLAVEDVKFRVEVVRTLRDSPHKEKAALLRALALDEKSAPRPAPAEAPAEATGPAELTKDAKPAPNPVPDPTPDPKPPAKAEPKPLPVEVRAEAVTGLDPTDKEDASALLTLVLGKDGPLRDEAMRTLRGTTVAEVREDLQHYVQTDKLEHYNPAVVRMLDPNWKLAGHRDDETDKWLALVESAKPQAADVAAGQRLFYSAKGAGCARCHTAQGRGGVAGPDLSTIGKMLSRERLLESILQPSKEIAPRYAAQLVETSDGEKRTLMYVGPAPDGTQIWADTNGKEHRIAPGEIESKQPLTTSIMPAGLHQSLTAHELRNLLAFLESLK